MKIAPRVIHTVHNRARNGAHRGAESLPLAIYDEHYRLCQQIGLPECYQARAWYDEHRVLWAAATLTGGILGAILGLVAPSPWGLE